MDFEKRSWNVCDESSEREGFCCLAVREEASGRLIADLADEPLDYPQCVERVWNEARIIAAAVDLLKACKATIDWHEKMNASDRVYDIGLSGELATLLYDAVASAEGRIETSYGGVIEENDENP